MERTEKVFEYTDYRCFLNDFFENQKKRRDYWSFGKWAQELKIKSPSTLIMLLRGQRNPGKTLIEKLAHYFRFDSEEAGYFRDLVKLHKAKDDIEMSVLLMEKLAEKHSGRQFQILDLQTFSAISNWYYYAIRQLVRLPGFREDPERISGTLNFKVTPKEIKDAFATLLRLGLLVRDEKGKLHLGPKSLDTPTDIASEGIKRFHEQVLENFRHGIRSISPDRREVSGRTFSMRARDLPKAKKLIRKFHYDLCGLLESDKGDSVFHLETALMPLYEESPGGEA